MSSAHPWGDGKAQVIDWECLNPVIEWCYCGKVDPLYLHGDHNAAGMVAWLILRGSMTIRTATGFQTVCAGNWIVLRPGRVYRDMDSATTLISICFRAGWPDQRSLYSEGLPVVFASESAPGLQRQAQKLVRFLEKSFGRTGTFLLGSQTTLPVYIRLQSLFTGWLATLVETLSALGIAHTRQGEIDERVRRGLFLIDHFPLEEPFPKAALARGLGLGFSQLDRVFVQATGHTPQSYFNQRRQAHARQALRQPGSSVKELAYSLGFRSVSHFSTWFRRIEGDSPTGYAHREKS